MGEKYLLKQQEDMEYNNTKDKIHQLLFLLED